MAGPWYHNGFPSIYLSVGTTHPRARTSGRARKGGFEQTKVTRTSLKGRETALRTCRDQAGGGPREDGLCLTAPRGLAPFVPHVAACPGSDCGAPAGRRSFSGCTGPRAGH